MSALPSEADIVCEFDLGRDGPIADYERSPRGQSAKKKAPAKFAGAAMMPNFDGCLLAGVGGVECVAHVGERVVKGRAENV